LWLRVLTAAAEAALVAGGYNDDAKKKALSLVLTSENHKKNRIKNMQGKDAPMKTRNETSNQFIVTCP